MLKLIAADHLGYRGESLIIFLGDYVDRGPCARDVLDILVRGQRDHMKFFCLRGNHEDCVRRFFTDHSVAAGWFHYGGLQTLRSYGVQIHSPTQDFEDIFYLRRVFQEAMPEAHREFIFNLPYTARYGDYVFVHAGIHPERSLEEQDPHHYMWMREPFLSSSAELGFMVVHGHSIRLQPEVRVNRIGIDTGAYVTGKLTCLVLQDEDQRFLTT